MRTLRPAAALLFVAALASPALAETKLDGSYEVKFEEMSTNCDPPRFAYTRGVVKIDTAKSSMRVAGTMLQHSLPLFASHIKQVPAVADVMRASVDRQLAVLEEHLGDKPYLVTDRPTTADVTLFSFTQAFRVRMNTTLTDGYPRLTAWYERFEKRPSAAFPGVFQ